MSIFNELFHYGTPRHSGRYPWGSGENPYQHSSYFMSEVNRMRKEGMSDTEIAGVMNMSTGEFRSKITISNEQIKAEQNRQITKLKDKGYSNVAIAEKLGISEGTVRNALKGDRVSTAKPTTSETALYLKEQLETKGMLEVGAGVERELGISDVALNAALNQLKSEGYITKNIQVDQMTNPGKKTTIRVLGTEEQLSGYINIDDVNTIVDYDEYAKIAEDPHPGFQKTKYGMYLPTSIDSNRIKIVYGDEGGSDKDGVIELRRGVDDISLGSSNYAQVRIAVDGTHYLKGMAIYRDDMPDGVDVIFNTNKESGTPKEDVFKKLKDDPDNPFGAAIKPAEKGGQRFYYDEDGKEHLNAVNIVNMEGDWDHWSKTLSSQFLSKQPKQLIQKQLDKSYEDKLDEYRDILEITNPTVKQKFLESFSEDCDASAVHLKAAALPRQAAKVILPVTELKDGECYCPTLNTGETVCLIRYPHAGTFEIPVLTVNNSDIHGKSVVGNGKDAIGINIAAARQLSGADFDGDTVMVIPVSKGAVGTKVKATHPLEGLKNFDTEQYAIKDKESSLYSVDPAHGFHKQMEMGKVSNLITDMTLYGASNDELVRAVKHSMVVIDAEKHHLDWRASEKENGIAELKLKYQGGERRGASTLISKASSEERIPQRKIKYSDKENPNVKNGIDIVTGKKVYQETGETYHKPIYEYEKDENGRYILDEKTGKKIKTSAKPVGYEEKSTPRMTKTTKMASVDDAYELISKDRAPAMAELVYADYANKLKSLANAARKEMMTTEPIKYSPSAKALYLPQVESLNSKLDAALRNAPRERKAQMAANVIFKAKQEDNPNMTNDEAKKIKAQTLAEQRVRYGAKRALIEIDDKEWEAIQAGAISSSKLRDILNNCDMDVIRDKAMPTNYKTELSQFKIDRISALASNGYTQAEIANQLGLSTSTVNKYLEGG